jgi:AMP-activated protein kinase-like protein
MTFGYHELVKKLLDGEIALADLPPGLRAEGQEAIDLLGRPDRRPVTLSVGLEAQVMRDVRAIGRRRPVWRWLVDPVLPPWALLAAAAATAAVVVSLRAPASSQPPVASTATVYVRFVLYAPTAKQVSVAGTFNQWDPQASPLARAAGDGVWTVTLPLPPGEHQYAFVVDGKQWVPDPAAPAVDDGFGRRNSVLAVGPSGVRVL